MRILFSAILATVAAMSVSRSLAADGERPLAEPSSWFADFNTCCARMSVEAYSIKIWSSKSEILNLRQQSKSSVQNSLRSLNLWQGGKIEAMFVAYGPGREGRLSYLTQAYYAGYPPNVR
ncbi:MAG: hypothetical protein AB7T49_07975 [Oligoflexales bacterium]